MILKKIGMFLISFGVLYSSAQVVGNRENSGSSPTTVKPAQLSGGGYAGDVNVFNGKYNASYPLGSVSTPGGLNYSVNLQYSPSYSVGQTPAVSAGIPYGEGWSVGIPMISVSNAVFFSFLVDFECVKKSKLVKDNDNYFDTTTVAINGRRVKAAELNGDLFWFSPQVNIPGVASGKAIFKYIDQDDAACTVFALNSFENYVEIRFYGDRWKVIDPSGNVYDFSTTLVSYHAPNNARVLNYESQNNNTNNEVAAVNEESRYGMHASEVLNVIEPKQAYTTWYCRVIKNRNIPNQNILFEYEKFGGFNYYQEFEQPLVKAKIDEKLRGGVTIGDTYDFLDYTAYTDILLTKVSSFTGNSLFEILDLGYETSNLIGDRMLDPTDVGVNRLDSLYAYETVYSQGGGTADFQNWNRYYHGKSDGAYDLSGGEPGISPRNPYLTNGNAGGDGYIRNEVSGGSSISFDHAFLESPRILDNVTTLVPGDIYEVKTKISDGNGSDPAMGTGTVDISIVTGNLGYTKDQVYYDSEEDYCYLVEGIAGNSFSSLDIAPSNIYKEQDYNKTRSTPVFTTQNQAIKWHLSQEATSLQTSNFFMMPNIPESYSGMNIQVGPGNSDTEYLQETLSEIRSPESSAIPSAYNAYSHMRETSDALAAYEDVAPGFGIGVPWAMAGPIYMDQMGGVDADNMQNTDAYQFWYNHTPNIVYTWDNEPTKFNESVYLQEVELVRYSKVPYMLSSVKMFRVNGEITPLNDTSGIVLIAQNDLEYGYDAKRIIENYPYEYREEYSDCPEIELDDTLVHATGYNQYVYTLNKIKTVPVAAWEKNAAVAQNYEDSTLLQTDFEYEWYGYEDDEILTFESDLNPGRRTRVLTKYIDQLGGETHIEYYPWNSKSSLREGRFARVIKCAASGQGIFGQSVAYDIHPAVRYLTKLDEKNTTTALSPANPIKRWEYVYDTTQIVYQSYDYDLPLNFRGGYKKSYSKGFAQTTVYAPKLESGEQTYTKYYHQGNIYNPILSETGSIVTPDLATIEEYLFFGKPKKIVQYNHLNQKEEETLFEYDYTKAFENGYARKRMVRDNLISPTDYQGVTNFVHTREYEYADYYKNEADEIENKWIASYVIFDDRNDLTNLSFYVGPILVSEMDTLAIVDRDREVISILIPGFTSFEPNINYKLAPVFGVASGENAKAIVASESYIGERWGNPIEKSKFLETYLYRNLQAVNPDFLFHSYFVKTVQQKTRSYDDFCEIDNDARNILEVLETERVLPHPFGPPIVNPVVGGRTDTRYIRDINNSGNGNSVEASLIANSPLSEAVLDVFVGKIGQYNSSVIKNVLVAQTALSDNILYKVFDKSNRLTQRDAGTIFLDQPYLSDSFLMRISNNTAQRSDQFVKNIYQQNPYLSDTVMLKLSETNNFSQNVLKDVLLKQGQVSQEVQLSLVEQSNSNSEFVIEAILFAQPVIGDAVYAKLVNNTGVSRNGLATIYKGVQKYPSDNALIALLNRSQPLPNNQLIQVLMATDRVFQDSLEGVILGELGEKTRHMIFELFTNFDPYSGYCGNPVIENRSYVESITEYDYYEANFDGATTAEGYKKLMGLEDVEGKVIPGAYFSASAPDRTLTEIKLKHQPSWQLFKTKTYSPDYPDAYQEQEFYYYYDLLNRKSRHFEYYDLESGHYVMDTGDPTYTNDTIIVSSTWPADYQIGSVYGGHLPLHDGERTSQRNNLRNIAFQKTTFSKNNGDTPAIMQSEYYNYDSRWNRAEQELDSTVIYDGPLCEEVDDYLADCADCFPLKWTNDVSEVFADIPWGYCAYLLTNNVVVCCPRLVDPVTCGYSISRTVGCNPDNDDPAASSGGSRHLSQEEALDRGMYFRSFVVQIDSVATKDVKWTGTRMDRSNRYIMDFYLGENSSFETDAFERRQAYAMYPFDTLTVRTVDERNRYTQVQLEHNVADVYTKYDYESTWRIFHKNSNNTACPSYGNYSSIYNKNIGVPTQITVGHGRVDSMSTQYAYYPNYSVDSIVDPNGHKLHYTYDDYDRLAESFDNERLLSSNNYAYWKRDNSLNFQERTAQNYVETTIFNSPVLSETEHIRAYIDPLGRAYSTSTSVDGDSTQVHSGTVLYDNWGRVTKAFKPYKLSNQSTYLPRLDTTSAYTHSKYENTQKNRVLRAAKYGILDIEDSHTIKQHYKLINEVMLACELDLKNEEAALLIDPEFEGDFKFIRVETEDEDGKKMVAYSNAIGQQVATLQYGESLTDKLVTLFGYDNYGNLSTSINPEEQWTTYQYNILGQLIKETTVDAGEVAYMYNKQGLLAVSQDENGRIGEMPPLGIEVTPYFRTFKYDDYGRLLEQRRSYRQDPGSLPVENNPNIDPMFYKDTASSMDLAGNPILLYANPEAYFEYKFSNQSSYDWMAKISYVDFDDAGPSAARVVKTGLATDFISVLATKEKAFTYGLDSTGNRLGKIKNTFSYNGIGDLVEKTSFLYNAEDQVKSELIEFSATSDFINPLASVTARLVYPKYNYRGSVELMEVDIYDDNVVDFQYRYTYDDWNRLVAIYVSYVQGELGKMVVSYTYDDALGLLTQTKHYSNISDKGCQSEEAQTITYAYDMRDRLTNISSELFDYALFYDDNAPLHADFTTGVSHDQNWNGNINGTTASYDMDRSNILNDPTGFQKATVYGYKYDLINRLYQADAIAGDEVTRSANSYGIGDVEYNYDRIGNIMNLKRGLHMDEITSTNLVHEEWNYQYQLGTNRLRKVDGVGTTTDRNYAYDSNGNLKADDHKSISAISYARANYPFHISKGSDEIDYLYSISDQRMFKEAQNSAVTTKEYYLKNIGILDMVDNKWTWYVTGADRVAKITPNDLQQPKNRSTSPATGLNAELTTSFYLYDHLGNTRVVYSPIVRCPSAMEYTVEYVGDYYPYGKTLRQYSNGETEKFLSTQHERDIETGLDYRGARFYDSDVGRFLSLDPLARKYPSLSDYSYVAGNPLMFIDPDGKKVIFPNAVSANRGNIWLQELGLSNEFRINKRGVLKKRYTPFTKNSTLVKSLNKERKNFNKVQEVVFTEDNNWRLQSHINPEDMVNRKGEGSSIVKMGLEQQNPFIGLDRVLIVSVIVSNDEISGKIESTQFVGSLLGVEGENLARDIFDLENLDEVSLKDSEFIYDDDSGASSPSNGVANGQEYDYLDRNGKTHTNTFLNNYFMGYIFPNKLINTSKGSEKK